VGAEITKIRPAVVISDHRIGKLPLRIVVPVTEWKTNYGTYPWFVKVEPSSSNGLTKTSGVDAFQVKSVSTDRFVIRLGAITDSQADDIASAIAMCVGSPT
jgi:mRNA interferase MazF